MSKQVIDDKLYKILEVGVDASEKQIHKSFLKLALKWHPDKWVKGSDDEKKIAEGKFKEIKEAHDILIDPKKREIYDQFGENGIKNNGGMPGFGEHMNEDMFNNIFGNMGGAFSQFMPGFGQGFGNRTKKETVYPNIEKKITISLKDIYLGTTIEFEVLRYNLKKNKQPTKEDMICNTCKGKGKILRQTQIRPGMIQQSEQICGNCSGACMKFPEDFFDKKSQKFTHRVPKGICEGNHIVIENNGHEVPTCFQDQYPGNQRSNIVIIVSETNDFEIDNYKYFRGVNESPFNIGIKLNIQCYEAICGTYKYIPFINGEYVCVKIPPGVIFKKDNKAVIVPKMGMPHYKKKNDEYNVKKKNENDYGDLFIILNIEEKFNIDQNQATEIWKLLTNKNMEDEHNKILKKSKKKYVESICFDDYRESDAYKNRMRDQHDMNNDDTSDDNNTHQQPGGCQQQ